MVQILLANLAQTFACIFRGADKLSDTVTVLCLKLNVNWKSLKELWPNNNVKIFKKRFQELWAAQQPSKTIVSSAKTRSIFYRVVV